MNQAGSSPLRNDERLATPGCQPVPSRRLPGRLFLPVLLELDGTASFFDLLLDLFGFCLGHAFLDCRRCAFDQILGFLQTQAGHFADSLDHANFLVAETSQHDVELGLLFSSGASTSTRCSSNSYRGSRNIELLFERDRKSVV